MKYLIVAIIALSMNACTTVNVYSDETVIVIPKSQPRNPDNPYDRRRSY
jgi:hypothetical protein